MWNLPVPGKNIVQSTKINTSDGIHALDRAVNTIESMAFLPTIESPTYYSKIAITSPVKGEMMLFINAIAAKELTKSINGTPMNESIHDTNKIKDAVSEILNIVAGQFMQNLLPPEQDFTIGLPITKTDKQADISSAMILRFYEINNMTLFIGIKGRELRKLYNNKKVI